MLWTDKEEALLIKEYSWGDKQEILALLSGRSWGAVKMHALRLGVKRLLPAGVQTIYRNGVAGKICTNCKTWMPLGEFSWKNQARGKLHSWCKACCNRYNARHYLRYYAGCYAENREAILKRQRDRYAENPEHAIIKTAVRRSKARVAAGGLVLTAPQWREILEEWGYRCAYCDRDESQFEGKLEREHVIPDSQGGLFTAANIVPACPDCNRKKGPRTPEQAGMQIHWELYDTIGVVVAPDF